MVAFGALVVAVAATVLVAAAAGASSARKVEQKQAVSNAPASIIRLIIGSFICGVCVIGD
jgi:hypothetical protein